MTRGLIIADRGRFPTVARGQEASTKSIGAFNGATAPGAKRTTAAWSV